MGCNIPPQHKAVFAKGIQHPKLHLWDAWSYCEGVEIHLYCLAVPRFLKDGTQIDSSDRNSYPFHMRHFSSHDDGETWKDEGSILEPRLGENRHDSKTIWSGSAELLKDGRKLVAYTGIYNLDEDRTFLQNIALGISNDGFIINKLSKEPLSCPIRDREAICNAGYYLGSAERLGHKDGEDGGPILAWRDPFIYVDTDGSVHLFWAAKVGSLKSALAHALLKEDGEEYRLDKLFPPVTLPDSDQFTQLELPKVYFDPDRNVFYLIVSTCNRLYEGQSDDVVDKSLRLYRSGSIDGPWEAHFDSGSQILKDKFLFGLTVLKTDFSKDRLLCIAPYTESAIEEKSLTFCESFYLDLKSMNVRN